MEAALLEILATLGKAALGYLAGKAMPAVFGDSKSEIEDVKKWIESAVKEIERFVADEIRKQLTARAVAEMVHDSGASITYLDDYAAGRDKDILDLAHGVTAAVIVKAQEFGLTTIIIYANAVSLRLLVLVALVKDFRNKGYKQRVVDTVEDGVAYVEQVIADHLTYLDAGIASVAPLVVEYRNLHPKLKDQKWWATFSYRGGSYSMTFWNEADARATGTEVRAQILASFTSAKADAMDNLHRHLRAVESDWRAVKEKIGRAHTDFV